MSNSARRLARSIARLVCCYGTLTLLVGLPAPLAAEDDSLGVEDKHAIVEEALDAIEQTQAQADVPPIPTPAPVSSSQITIEPGAIQTLVVDGIARIAIGNPDIADITVVSLSEVLLRAKSAGKTNLIVWDRLGQRVIALEVIDRNPEELERQLRKLIKELKLPRVKVRRERDKVFLVGKVPAQPDLDRLEQLLSAFTNVTNLVTVQPSEEAIVPPKLIKLGVQILEINRQDLEKLGLKWTDPASGAQSITVTESTMPAASLGDMLLRIGQTVTRTNLSATLNALVQQNRARILAEPKLVTAAGKEASSFIGVEVPVLQATSFTSVSGTTTTSIDYRETGVLLKMTPTLQGEGKSRKIVTVMEAEVSSIDTSVALSVPVAGQTISVPGFKNRRIKTEVATSSGEAVFIAGLLEVEDSEVVDQVPALGSMPVLGRLFRSPQLKAIQREIVIVVTPELVDEEQVSPEDRDALLEQAMAVAEVQPTVDNPTVRYAMDVQDRIAKAIRYPEREKALGVTGQVKLRVHMFKDGSMGRALIAESSGVDSFDVEALKAAEQQSPYPPFPAGLTQQDLWLELPVLFRP